MPRVAVLFDATPAEMRLLEEAVGGPVARRPSPMPMDVRDAEIVVVHSFADLPKGLLQEAKALRWVISLPAGANHVPFQDLPPGAQVLSTHGPNAGAIAEHAFTLLLAAAKRVNAAERELHEGRFEQEVLSRRLAGGTLLVLGAGPVGSAVLRLGRAFGMRTELVRRSGAPHPDADVVLARPQLGDALARADAVVLALPLTRETVGIVGASQLARMKPDAILVNVARGKLVDRESLARHLEASPAFTYATDVWWRYPKEGQKFEEPLLARPNVIGTPHAAALTPGWREEMVAAAAKLLRAVAAGGEPPAGSVEDPADYAGLRG